MIDLTMTGQTEEIRCKGKKRAARRGHLVVLSTMLTAHTLHCDRTAVWAVWGGHPTKL